MALRNNQRNTYRWVPYELPKNKPISAVIHPQTPVKPIPAIIYNPHDDIRDNLTNLCKEMIAFSETILIVRPDLFPHANKLNSLAFDILRDKIDAEYSNTIIILVKLSQLSLGFQILCSALK